MSSSLIGRNAGGHHIGFRRSGRYYRTQSFHSASENTEAGDIPRSVRSYGAGAIGVFVFGGPTFFAETAFLPGAVLATAPWGAGLFTAGTAATFRAPSSQPSLLSPNALSVRLR
jgi:hypothetical protein